MKKLLTIIFFVFICTASCLAVINDISPKTALFDCDGSTTQFSFSFTVDESADIEVIIVDSSNTETVLTQDTDYTVSISSDGTGSITTTNTYSSAYDLIIRRDTEKTQELDLQEGGVFSAESLEDELDKLTRLTQENSERLNRAALLPRTDQNSISMPRPSASKALCWDASASALTNCNISTATSVVLDYIGNYSSLADAVSDIGSARTTLVIDEATTISDGSTVTIPSTLNLLFLNGGIISGVSGGGTETLNINGPITAGGYSIFGDDLTVDLSNVDNKCKAEWFSTLEKAQESDAPYITIESPDWSISSTVTFDQNNQTVEFIGRGKVSTTDDTLSGFAFSGNYAKIINPNMEGPGTYVLDGSTQAALIYITGDDSEVSGGYLVNPPTAGVYVDDGDRANIHHLRIEGGQSSFTSTLHFGIKIEDSIGSKVTNNIISHCVQGIKNSQFTTNRHTEVSNNYIASCYDHAIYGGGTYENFHHNQIYHDVGNTAIIGQESYGNYSNNEIYTVSSAITIRDAIAATANDNIIISATTGGFGGITMGRNTDGNVQYNIVNDNIIKFIGTGGGDGIVFQSQGAASTVDFCTANSNTIYNSNKGGGDAAIYIVSLGQGQQNRITGNNIDTSAADGIQAQYMKNSTISGNTIKDADTRGIDLVDFSESEISRNTILDEVGGVTTIGIREADSSDTCDSNRYYLNHFNLNGLSSSSLHTQTQIPTAYTAGLNGEVWTLSSATTTFYPVDGSVHFVDPAADGRDFNPGGYWPIGSTVTVINTADAAEAIEFDQTGINVSIAQNKRGIFGFDGASWYTINIY